MLQITFVNPEPWGFDRTQVKKHCSESSCFLCSWGPMKARMRQGAAWARCSLGPRPRARDPTPRFLPLAKVPPPIMDPIPSLFHPCPLLLIILSRQSSMRGTLRRVAWRVMLVTCVEGCVVVLRHLRLVKLFPLLVVMPVVERQFWITAGEMHCLKQAAPYVHRFPAKIRWAAVLPMLELHVVIFKATLGWIHRN